MKWCAGNVWQPLGLGGLVVVVALGVLPSTVFAQNATRSLASDAGLPDAPARGNPIQTPSIPSPEPNSGSQPGVKSAADIRGAVLDANGTVVPEAQVTLSGAGLAGPRVTTTDVNGQFTFADLIAGTYGVMIASPGFETYQSPPIALAAGEKRELTAIALPVAKATTDMEVIATQDQVAAAQVHLAEKQRALGIIPNFYSSYIWDAAPLTPKLKFGLAARSTLDPVTFAQTAALAGVEQAHNTFPGYGGGPDGYAKRYGAAYTDNVIGRLIGSAILPSLFHQDPRYFYKGTGSIFRRTLYAVGQTVITRGDNGRSQPNYSHILGNFAAAGISNLYRAPVDRGAGLTFRNGLSITASNAAGNLIREFLLRKLTPNVPAYAQGNP